MNEPFTSRVSAIPGEEHVFPQPLQNNSHVWLSQKRAIMLGVGPRSGRAFCLEMDSRKVRIGNCARDVICNGKIHFSSVEHEVNIVWPSIGDLDLVGASLPQALIKVEEHWCKYAPVEVALQLAVRYDDQPDDECLIIGTRPVVVGKHHYVFLVGRDKSGQKYICCISPLQILGRGAKIAFQLFERF